MKYTKEERLGIGKEMIERGLTYAEAAGKYGVSNSSLSAYRDAYLESIGEKPLKRNGSSAIRRKAPEADIAALEAMTREELIDQVILAKAQEARAKKGYEVKGGGTRKEFVPLSKMNS